MGGYEEPCATVGYTMTVYFVLFSVTQMAWDESGTSAGETAASSAAKPW